jgi:hypothetical protein
VRLGSTTISEAVMANYFPCPNPACTYQFDADQLPAAAMVTCPLCRTRFPYRAATGHSKASKSLPFEPEDSAADDRGRESPRQRSSTNRLVNPRYVPKSNKTQTAIMLVGFTAVVAAVLTIILFTMKKNPFKGDSEPDEFLTNERLNYKFLKLDLKNTWTDDKKAVALMTKGLNGFEGTISRRNDSDARIAVLAKDFESKKPRPNELRLALLDMLRRGFTQLDPPVPFDFSIAGETAAAVQFQGEYDGTPMTGEGFAFDHEGIGYIILYFAPNDVWDAAKSELESLRKSFAFVGPRKKGKEIESPVEHHFVESGNYEVEDRDNAWERAIVQSEDGPQPKSGAFVIGKLADKDKNATMAFRLKKSKYRPVPQTLVIVTDQANDSLEAARLYWLKKVEADDGRGGEAKITLEPMKKSPSGTELPRSDAQVGIYQLTNSDQPRDKQFCAISAMNIGDKLVFAVSWCRDLDSEYLEPIMLNFVASLHERK